MRKYKNSITLSLENIISFSRNITSHFTGKEKIITLVFLIIMLSSVNITSSLSGFFYDSNASALNHQTSTNIGFTFRPTLNVSLSNNNLVIDNLIPGGEAKDSNIATINVSTNIAEGYNLFATVGSNSSNSSSNNSNSTNSTNTNTTNNNGYNTTNLVNTINNDYTLTSLSSNIPNLNSFTNNNWGYSYSLDSGTTWISGDYDNASTGYNGLPLYTNTGIKLVEKADNTNSAVDFKIAARVSNTQPSGAYTNTINFTAVSNVIPTSLLDAFIAHNASMHNGYFAMQDMTSEICQSVDIEESELQLIDLRDNKLYWVAKLKDGNCWMTQNLDLDLSHDRLLTSNDTDLNDSTSTAYQDGYTVEGGIIYWTPASTANTINFEDTSVDDWVGSNAEPYSANKTDSTETGHTSLGNYYNWTATIASNNSSSITSQTLSNIGNNPQNSICPKGWRLPTISSQSGTIIGSTNEFVRLNHIYNNSSISSDENLIASPLFWLRGGYINGAIYINKATGYLWSSTPATTNGAYYAGFLATRVYVDGSQQDSTKSRPYGFPIRCLAR